MRVFFNAEKVEKVSSTMEDLRIGTPGDITSQLIMTKSKNIV